MCTPKFLEELVVGYLFSEGIISSYREIVGIDLEIDKKSIYVETENEATYSFTGSNIQSKNVITTACSQNRTVDYHLLRNDKTAPPKMDLTVSYDEILEIAARFNKMSELFLKTGGVHSCIFINHGEEKLYVEDIGRHNCIDKIVGYILINNVKLVEPIVFTSGRVSSDMIYKVLKANIGCIISRSAPTNLGINLAKKYNLNLIGFARGGKLNIYN